MSNFSAWDAFKWAGGISATALIAVVSFLWTEVSDTRAEIDLAKRDLQDFRVEVARDYASNDRMGKLEARLDAQFERIMDRLDDLAKSRQ